MNYTQIEINGEKVGLKFGMASFRYLANSKFVGDSQELDEISIGKILYSGYYNNCIIKDVEPSLTLENFVDYIESNTSNEDFIQEIKRVISIWGENEIIKKANNTETAKKKTSRGKK